MHRFSGEVALVTGSSNGIGRATELIDSTIRKFGRLDILVNNAGTAFADAEGKTGVDQNVSDYDKVMQINLRSVVTLTQKAKKYLIESKGEVVNVSSIAGGKQAMPGAIYYAMSKSALDQFTRCAAIDLIQHGVRVNSVSPGGVTTGIGEAMGMPAGMFEKMMRIWETKKECVPCGKVAEPVDIAYIIAFLADRKLSSYIIGQSIVADGGSSLIMRMQTVDVADIMKQ